jgi:hypothetical protein
MMKAHDLPEPVDGPTPIRNTPEWQARRMNRLADAIWQAVPLLGKDDRIAISLTPDSGHTQITIHVHAPADLIVAESMVFRLGWDVEAEIKRFGMTRHYLWHGMIGGFRAYAVWVESPAPVDSQGREELPAGVGVGDRAADAEHVELLKAMAGGSTGPVTVVDHPGVGREVAMTSTRGPSVVPPMQADLIRLGYEL